MPVRRRRDHPHRVGGRQGRRHPHRRRAACRSAGREIEAKAAETTEKAAGAAIALYEEPDVLVKVIRDLFNEDFSGLIVSGDDAWTTINEYVEFRCA